MKFRILFPVWIALSFSANAFAWNATGHMLVADIALQHLQPSVKRVCEELLAEVPAPKSNTFIDCAPWADDTKTRRTGPWHYIDLYFKSDGNPTDKQPDPQNVVWAISRFSRRLVASNEPDEKRADALRYLIHFVGDIHQPLHCTSRITPDQPEGDKGGNDFYFSHPSSDNSRPHELHYLWDDGGGLFKFKHRPITSSERQWLDALAAKALSSVTAGEIKHELAIESPMAWAKESQAIAIKYVYLTPEFQEPSEQYYKMAQKISMERCAIAGLRLAQLLNHLLGKPARSNQ